MTGSVSVGVFVTLGRTDFPVSGEDLHRNFASVAIGTRVLTPGTGGALGVTIGLGALADDDVSEVDPGFRSSANLTEMLLLGIEVSRGVRDSWGLGVFVRDQVTGWFYSIIDSEESDIGHRFVIGAGLYFGT